jgi:hypothetical protein
MSDKKRNREKKEKYVEAEEMDKKYMEMPMQNNQNQGQMQHNCPMMYQCPMVHHCPMMPQPNMQMPNIQMPTMQSEDMRDKDWFEDWDESSDDSSFEFDSDDFYSPEKYYENNKKHQYPYFWPPYFPGHHK